LGVAPIHYELTIWGWLVQFVMGTAYWIFPRFLKGESRGSALPAWIMVCLYNIGLILLAISVFILANFSAAMSWQTQNTLHVSAGSGVFQAADCGTAGNNTHQRSSETSGRSAPVRH